MKIGVYCRNINDSFKDIWKSILDFFHENKIELFCNIDLKPFINNDSVQITYYDEFQVFYDEIDVMISIGGDGTFLNAITYIGNKKIPMLGINSGRLGFLADIAPMEVLDVLKKVVESDYLIESRSLLEVHSNSFNIPFPYALNDFTIRRSDSSSLLQIDTFINDEFLNTYWADGLIISTPTGSTAYSMSVGGPIVLPNTKVLILSPIASHNLSVRPVVIDMYNEIKFTIKGRNLVHMASLDSRTFIFDKENEFVIKKAKFEINIIKFDNHDYYDTLRNKLMWGIDKRN